MKIITREEYQEYLKEQRKRQQSDKLSPEIRTFIKENLSDIRKAFIGTNIKSVEI